MIDDLRAIAIFAKVADEGSFSAAGRALRLSNSVVSHHVKALENRHGVSLFRRSTRALSLTHEGQKLLDSARRMVGAAEEGLNAIANISAEPAGALRMTMPAFLANSAQETAIWQFARRYPNVTVNVHSSDTSLNLIAEGFDLAIRLGKMADSSLKGRQVGTFERCLVAAPTYLRTIETPKHPEDLVRCDFVLLDMLPNKFIVQRGHEEIVVHPEHSRVLVNSVAAARSAVVAGLGMQRLPLSEVQKDLESGRLEIVLPEWSLPTLNIYAVWPEASQQSALVRLLLAVLVGEQEED